MRGLCIVVLATLAVAQAVYVPDGTTVKYADHEFLVKQKAIFEMFENIHQKNFYVEHHDVAMSYKIPENFVNYKNVDAVKEFYDFYKYGMLPKGEVFSINYEKHREETISLFHFFYYAKDWETFYKSMCWAREHVNEGMFVYALTAAVLHREDLQGIILPAPYEINPHYFVASEVIQKAYNYKMSGFSHFDGKGKKVIIPATLR